MQTTDEYSTHPAGQRVPAAGMELQESSRLEILLDIHQAILSSQNLKATAQSALKHIRSLVPNYRAGSILLLGQSVEVLSFDFDGIETDWPADAPLDLMDLAVDLQNLQQGHYYLVPDLRELDELLPIQSLMLANGIRSYLTVPLLAHTELVGLLNLASDVPVSFTSEIIAMAGTVAGALAVAVQQSRLLEEEQKRRREAEVMRDVMSALASSVNLNQVLEVVLRNLGKVVRYDRAALYMQNENSQFQLPDFTGVAGGQFPKIFPLDDPIIAELRRGHAPLVIEDIQQDERFVNWPEHDLVRGWMGIPLFATAVLENMPHGNDLTRANDLTQGSTLPYGSTLPQMIGVVSLGDLEPDAYNSTDARLAQVFTDQVAEILYRARLQETSARRAEELEMLTAFSFALRQAEGQDNVLSALIDQTANVFGASRGTFLMLEKDASTLVISFSQDPELVGHWHAHGDDPLWQVVRSGKAHFIFDVSAERRLFPYRIYHLLFEGMQSAVLLPLNSPESTFGVLCFTFQNHQDFDLEDRRLFHAISEIAGTALRRAAVLESLEKQVNTRTRHLSTLYEISAIASEPVLLERLLERMLAITLEVMESPAGAIHLLDDSLKTLNLAAQVALPEGILPGFTTLPAMAPFWRNLLRSSEPAALPDLKVDPRAPVELFGSLYPAYLAAPIRAKGQSLGLISVLSESILRFTIEDITLFTTIAEQIGSTVERARLQKQAERAAVAEERQRLARELHDSISQLLYSLVLYAGAGRKVLRQGDLQNTAEYLQRIDQTSQQALKEMRLMVYELRPSVFREEGLLGALNRRLQAVEKRTGMNAQLVVDGPIDLDEALELALYRITEEALNNTLKHGEATQVVIRITARSNWIDLEIRDDGKGFILQEALAAGGLGLMGIRERVNHLGGSLEIVTSPGQGTLIHVRLEVHE